MKGGVLLKLICDGCGESFAYVNRPGRNPRWCSERCRKRTLYGGKCEICGAITNGYDGPGTASDRCSAHNRPAEDHHAKAEVRTREMLALRNKGMLNAEIAARMGVSRFAVNAALSRSRLARFGLAQPPSPYHTGANRGRSEEGSDGLDPQTSDERGE